MTGLAYTLMLSVTVAVCHLTVPPLLTLGRSDHGMVSGQPQLTLVLPKKSHSSSGSTALAKSTAQVAAGGCR